MRLPVQFSVVSLTTNPSKLGKQASAIRKRGQPPLKKMIDDLIFIILNS